MEETDFVDPFQSGFRPKYGTETEMVNDLRRTLDKESVSLLLLFGLSVVFRTISPLLLLECLSEMGVPGIVFTEFLLDRYQKVVLGGVPLLILAFDLWCAYLACPQS